MPAPIPIRKNVAGAAPAEDPAAAPAPEKKSQVVPILAIGGAALLGIYLYRTTKKSERLERALAKAEERASAGGGAFAGPMPGPVLYPFPYQGYPYPWGR